MAQEIADSKLIDTWSSSGNIVEPDVSKIIEGWQLGEQPPHEYMNWLQNIFGSKLNHILKNGVASWNNETEYLAGSSVQHNGNVWLCKTTNTNSAPTDVNANWKKIITVESLTTVLNGYVKNTGDETIDGIKTFSSSPIVPTPTANTQVTNKAYVDSKVEVAFVANDARVKTALNASGTAPIYASRAWAVFNGTGTIALMSSGNISSLVDDGAGKYTLNTISTISLNCVVIGSASGNSYPNPYSDGLVTIRAKATTGISVSTGPAQRGATEDNININVAIIF